MPAAVAVISAFLGGLAIGAWVLDSRIRASDLPAKWYAALETIIAGWALLLIAGTAWFNDQIGWLTGPTPGPLLHWTVAFLGPLVLLAPATVAMGATLPSMDRLVEGIRSDGRSIGALYAANTLGAVAGTLGATFWLIPNLGFRHTLVTLAMINLLCAAAVVLGFVRARFPLRFDGGVASKVSHGDLRLAMMLLLTGLLGIGYEVLGARVIAQVLENTVYSFASVLSVYLLGTSLGAAAYHCFLRNLVQDRLLGLLLAALSAACLVGVLLLSRAGQIHEATLQALGPGKSCAVASEMMLATTVFALPTFLMGMTFSLLAQMFRDRVGGVGRALSINTLGGAWPLRFSPVLLPRLGAKWALIAVGLGYFALSAWFSLGLPAEAHFGAEPKAGQRAANRRERAFSAARFGIIDCRDRSDTGAGNASRLAVGRANEGRRNIDLPRGCNGRRFGGYRRARKSPPES